MPPRLISGLSELAPGHDALICDVWGVIHDGQHHHPAAAEALRRFRADHGPVILLTNAPRVAEEVAAQCASYGVPADCYDAIVSSGGATRDALAMRANEAMRAGEAGAEPFPIYYLGPDRDLAMIQGLPVRRASAAEAKLILCIGMVDDWNETPEDYAGTLAALKARDLVMLCANPDLVVHRGDRLLYCGGSLAAAYEALGGQALYFGKPHRPIYDAALAAAARVAQAAGRPVPRRPLAVGDGLLTDILGANRAGLEAVFVADGVHGEEVEPYNADHLDALLTRNNVFAQAALRMLIW